MNARAAMRSTCTRKEVDVRTVEPASAPPARTTGEPPTKPSTRKTRRPARIRIGAWPFSIIARKGFSSQTDAMGTCGADTQQIVIDSQLGKDVEKATVIHESLHGAWSQTALSDRFTKEQEEEIIRTLDPLLYALLRDNPELVAWIMEGI